MNRRNFLALSGATLGLTALSANAAPYYSGQTDAAANGYDVVAYFTQSAAVPGDASISFEWDGDIWYFSSAENRDLFAADPAAYAPQYGAYCAFAVAHGATASTDPEAWTVYDDKLYLNFSKGVRTQWQKDIPGNIARGDANWPGIQAGL